VIIGGFGSWFGALLGAFLLTWLPLRLTSLGSWWPVIYGALMMLIATWMPGGIIGVASNLIRRGRGGPRLRSPLPTRRDEAEPAREAA
jgi:branched-chain amino acid transport system permease protein